MVDGTARAGNRAAEGRRLAEYCMHGIYHYVSNVSEKEIDCQGDAGKPALSRTLVHSFVRMPENALPRRRIRKVAMVLGWVTKGSISGTPWYRRKCAYYIIIANNSEEKQRCLLVICSNFTLSPSPSSPFGLVSPFQQDDCVPLSIQSTVGRVWMLCFY